MRFPHHQPPPLTRRQMLKTCGCGFGGLALSSLLQRDLLAATPGNPLAPRPPHFAPKAKRIIFLHMHGGPSQHDLFEYKPLLVRDDNKPLPFAKPRVQFNETGNLFKSPWEFKQHGQSGAWVSELLPNIASVVDELCFIRSMWGTNAAHGGAILAMNTGSDRFVRPSMGPDTKWDHHSGLITGLPQSCAEVDRPVAGLIKDLKSRGLLEETLVLWGGEFGRTPGAEAGARNGRDHNPHGYTMFMAGGGTKPGHSHGRTDDYGYYAIEDKVHIHDLHATILHLLGLDHERLTYRSQGRDFRLTDVEGLVVDDIIA